VTLDIEKFIRKSFPVDAVRVTVDNLEEVAKWCSGEIREDTTEDNPSGHSKMIWVMVQYPMNDRQSKAYVGDWVLYSGRGYKVYTDRGFRKVFDEKVAEQNVFESGVTSHGGIPGISPASSNPGGSTHKLG
jgi:hypothetical protein